MPSRVFVTEQNSFTAGVLGVGLYARYDLAAYYQGAARLDNVIVLPQGGVRNRPGEETVAEIDNFVLSETSGRLRLYRADGQPRAPAQDFRVASELDRANFWMIPFRLGPENAFVICIGINGVENPSPNCVIQAFDIANEVDVVIQGAENFGMFCAEDLATPKILNWAQEQEELFICGDTEHFYKLTYVSRSHVDQEEGDHFDSRDVVTLRLDTVTFPTTTSIGDPASGEVRVPCSIAFYNNRMWLGGLPDYPTTLWASEPGNFQTVGTDNGFQYPSEDDDVFADEPIEVTLDTPSSEKIVAIAPAQRLLILTTQAEYACEEDIITPLNAFFVRESTYGSRAGIAPVVMGNKVIFVQQRGGNILELTYDGETQTYDVRPLTELIPGLIKDPLSIVHDVGRLADSSDRIYVAQADGSVAVLSLLTTQQVKAWTFWPALRKGEVGETGDILTIAIARLADQIILAKRHGERLVITRLDEELTLVHSVSVPGNTLAQFRARLLSLYLDSGGSRGAPDVDIIRYTTDMRTGEQSSAYFQQLTTEPGESVNRAIDRIAEAAITINGPDQMPDPTIRLDRMELGINTPIEIRTMPLNPTYQQKSTQYRLKRLKRLFLETAETESVDARYLRNTPYPVLRRRLGERVALASHVTGTTERRFYGYRRGAFITFTQPTPGQFHMLGYALEVQTAFVPV